MDNTMRRLPLLLLFLLLAFSLRGSTLQAGPSSDPIVPNPALTPGLTRQVSLKELCRAGSSKDARHVTAHQKRLVFEAYGIDIKRAHEFEVDHLISLELAGSNGDGPDDIRNLWPESYRGHPNARDKDRVENALHRKVCSGELPLAEAQELIRRDWREAYRRLIGPL